MLYEKKRTPKNGIADVLRGLILQDISHAHETDRAEADLNALSFQSTSKKNRHIWISIFSDAQKPIVIDLEDWDYKDTWDNSIACVEVSTYKTASAVCKAWLSGANASECIGLSDE